MEANIGPAGKQRNKREENEAIKAASPPEDWSAAKRAQKDVDARGKFIRGYQVTAANVHDSQVFGGLLAENTSRDVWADSAYLSAASLKRLKASGYRPHIQRYQRMMRRNHPIPNGKNRGNRTRARIRSRVEHVFGMQIQRAGTLLIRTVGLVRAAAKIGLRNLAYNMDRLGLLLARA